MRAVVFLAAALVSFSVQAQSVPQVNFKTFDADHVQGAKLSHSDLKGKVVLVDFWAAWCDPCKEALPHYNKLYNKYKDKGLVVIGLNEDDDAKERDGFLKTHPLDFSIYHDKSKKMVKDFQVQALPSLFVFDKNLKPVALFRGFNADKPQALEKKVRELLGL